MIQLKELLIKINNILISEEVKKNLVVDSVFRNTGLKIKKEEIEIKNGIIYLNIKPIYKNEIFFKKEKILSYLKEGIGKRSPVDII